MDYWRILYSYSLKINTKVILDVTAFGTLIKFIYESPSSVLIPVFSPITPQVLHNLRYVNLRKSCAPPLVSLKGYLIIAFMITLGISLKYIPGIPASFFAWFYMGLGPGLLSAGIRFLIRWWKAK